IMTKKCPTCGGDGIVLSETSAAVEIERRLRALAAGSRSQAYRVELAAKVASSLIGPGASRLQELEKQTRRRFYLQGKADTHLDHFLVLAEGKREELAPAAPVAEGAADKPTRRTSGSAATVKTAELDDPEAEEAEEEEDEAEADDQTDADTREADEPDDEILTAVNGAEAAAPRKKTRRGSRGGR